MYPTVIEPGDVETKNELSIHIAAEKLINEMAKQDEKFAMLTPEFRNGSCKKYQTLYEYVEKKSQQQIVSQGINGSSLRLSDTEEDESTQAGKHSPKFGSDQKTGPLM